MAIVSDAKIQQWLESTKLDVATDVEDKAELEETAKNVVFSMVSQRYDVASWIDEATTPSLIQDAMSMFIAAWIYNRAYSEDGTTTSSYSKWLEEKATALLNGIASGTIELSEIPIVELSSTPSFYPNDSAINEYDELESPKFTMGSRF